MRVHEKGTSHGKDADYSTTLAYELADLATANLFISFLGSVTF